MNRFPGTFNRLMARFAPPSSAPFNMNAQKLANGCVIEKTIPRPTLINVAKQLGVISNQLIALSQQMSQAGYPSFARCIGKYAMPIADMANAFDQATSLPYF